MCPLFFRFLIDKWSSNVFSVDMNCLGITIIIRYLEIITPEATLKANMAELA